VTRANKLESSFQPIHNKRMKNKETFIKLCAPSFVKDLLKEAKRVKYLIEKDDMSFIVRDDETNDLVFKGIRMNRTFYAVNFSKKYWVEPIGQDYKAEQLQ
jgi:hypothetical protein